MSDKKEKTLEKVKALLDKLSNGESIEVWKESGDWLHNKISEDGKKKQEETEQLLKSLNK